MLGFGLHFGWARVSMNMRIFGFTVAALVALCAGDGGQALASTCSGEYNTSNGTTALPGTDIGTVAAGCEIGPFSATEGANGNVAAVNTTNNPSIYKFEWGGGNLTIQEELGNNGIGYNIDVELAQDTSSLALNSGGSLSSLLVSTSIVYQSGPSAPVDIIDSLYLAAGTYVLDTYLGTCATGDCSGSGSSTDPQYQVLFTPLSATPLPAAMPLFATGLCLVLMLGWHRKRKTTTQWC
jgi:hypothetical protein